MENEKNESLDEKKILKMIEELGKTKISLSNYMEYPPSYEYTLTIVDNIEELKQFFIDGNWSIRTSIMFEDLVFIQQLNR